MTQITGAIRVGEACSIKVLEIVAGRRAKQRSVELEVQIGDDPPSKIVMKAGDKFVSHLNINMDNFSTTGPTAGLAEDQTDTGGVLPGTEPKRDEDDQTLSS